MARYEIELWSSTGNRLADISGLATNRHFEIWRNQPELLTFDLDLTVFETFASSVGMHPRELLMAYQTDVKLKRNGQYLFGTQVTAAPINITDQDLKISVMATGYLDMLTKRYVTNSYVQQDRAIIAAGLITATQAQARGDMGVTIDPDLQLVGVLSDRDYARQQVRAGVQDLTQLEDAPFDIAIDADKVFHTYQQVGSLRTDVRYIYGGPHSNITGLYDENSAASLYNRVIGLGSGFGADQLTTVQDDVASQIGNYLREDIRQYNSVVNQNTIDEDAAADLALESTVLEIPQLTINGNDIPEPFFTVGDRLPLMMVGHPYLDPLTGIRRLEKLEVTLDDNDFESSVILYFDNPGLSG